MPVSHHPYWPVSTIDNVLRIKRIVCTLVVKRYLSVRSKIVTRRLPERALQAFRALNGRIVGFSEPQSNLKIRDIQESTHFLLKKMISNNHHNVSDQ